MAPKSQEQKVVICLAGLTGCGKSTAAKRLAKKYGLRYISGGEALKALARAAGARVGGRGWWETKEGTRFLRQRMTDLQFDSRVDEWLIEEAKRGDVVLDSWTMPWLLKVGFKVWLEASSEVRAKRIAERDGISMEKAFKALEEKDEGTKKIYKTLYGFELGKDFSPFNVVLDTSNLGAEEVFQTLCLLIERLLLRS